MRLQFLQPGSVVQVDCRGGGGQRLQRFDELARGGDREMPKQRGAVGPLLEKHQPQRVLAVDMDGVRNASGLAAGTMDVRETELLDLLETILSRRHAAGYHDHLIPRLSIRVAASPRLIRRRRAPAAAAASVSTRHA